MVVFEQGFDGRTHPIHDGPQVRRLAFGRTTELFQGGEYGAAIRVTENNHELRAETLGRELNASYLRGSDNVSGHPDDEEVPETLIENDLRRRARVRTTEDDGKGILTPGDLFEASLIDEPVVAGGARKKPPIALPETKNAVCC